MQQDCIKIISKKNTNPKDNSRLNLTNSRSPNKRKIHATFKNNNRSIKIYSNFIRKNKKIMKK